MYGYFGHVVPLGAFCSTWPGSGGATDSARRATRAGVFIEWHNGFSKGERPMNRPEAIEALSSLSTGVIGSGPARRERPHKPVMLLAVLDAVATGKARWAPCQNTARARRWIWEQVQVLVAQPAA